MRMKEIKVKSLEWYNIISQFCTGCCSWFPILFTSHFWKRILWNKCLGAMKMQHWRLMIASALCYHCVNSTSFFFFWRCWFLYFHSKHHNSIVWHWLFRFLFDLCHTEFRSLWRKAHLNWFVSTSTILDSIWNCALKTENEIQRNFF